MRTLSGAGWCGVVMLGRVSLMPRYPANCDFGVQSWISNAYATALLDTFFVVSDMNEPCYMEYLSKSNVYAIFKILIENL
jgi:hypothetical protein